MDELGQLLGESPAINSVRGKLRQLLERQPAGRRLPAMLIRGETGTGKGLVARLVHRMGPRKGGPFMDINCPAIPETLLEAELFGFERGAFTGAHRAKPGLFQAAHGGTLFLDEVGLLPTSIQAKLLTAIEERSVRRLGSTRPESVDACLISATNIDLQAALGDRRFREDLYHRLAVITLDLPALRDRERDVLLLAERFLARACVDYGLPPKRLDAQAQARLLTYAWPGNIRELANVIERAALFAESPVITGAMLDPLPVGEPPPGATATRAISLAVTPETLDALKRLLLRESQVQPVALVFEDLHWIDGETQALLDSLVESLGSARLLLLVNHRLEYQHAWGSKEASYDQMRLDALPAESAGDMLNALLGTIPH